MELTVWKINPPLCVAEVEFLYNPLLKTHIQQKDFRKARAKRWVGNWQVIMFCFCFRG